MAGDSETPKDNPSSEVTLLLKRLAEGDKSAVKELLLLPLVHKKLCEMAAFHLHGDRPFHTWQTTDLVNEAYLKLSGAPNLSFNGRSHFFGYAAEVMRHLLTDYAKRRRAKKRGGDLTFVPLVEGYEIPDFGIPDRQCEMIADLDEALKLYAAIDPEGANCDFLEGGPRTKSPKFWESAQRRYNVSGSPPARG
jgi:RNA polymerase sigma factor (TIGR02999 family)